MHWTWAFDAYVGGALALGTLAGVLLAFAWWAAGAVWLCRRWGTRTAMLLPHGLALGLGWMNEPLLAACLFVLWLSAETLVPQLLRGESLRGPVTPFPAAIFAAAGALACLVAVARGPLDPLGAFVLGRLGQLALLCTLLATITAAGVLRRRYIASPALRAALGAGLVLAWDGLHLAHGAWTVLLLGLPLLFELAAAALATLRSDRRAGGRRLAAAAVWALAFAGLVAHSRFNLWLSERRSADMIAACRQYEAAHGRLPGALQDLVPDYLPRVPQADWSLLGDFHYTAESSPSLSYFAPWPDTVTYLFDQDEWQVVPGAGFPSPPDPTPPARSPAATPGGQGRFPGRPTARVQAVSTVECKDGPPRGI